MPDYTEAACDACPHKCRAGIYVTGTVMGNLECATRNGTRDWRQTDRQADVKPSFVRAPAPDDGPVTFVPAGETVLLGCQPSRRRTSDGRRNDDDDPHHA